MNRVLQFALVMLVVTVAAPAALGQFLLTDADRVVFFGDRLVDPSSGFTVQVETFLRVRYPESKTRVWHHGKRGSTAADGNARFDDEVAQHKPTVVVLCFGLEDPGMKSLDEAKVKAFEQEYRKLIERCKAAGAKVWAMTPPAPNLDKSRKLRDLLYDDVVAAYANTIRSVATGLDVPVIDWYRASKEYRASHEANARLALTKASGVDPTPLGAAVATDLVLNAWQAAPLSVTIEADWTLAQPALVSVGSIKATKPDPEIMRIALKGIPLSWYVANRGAILANDWPPARFCNYTLKINNIPDGGYLVAEAGDGDRRPRGAKPFLSQMLSSGWDISNIGPLAPSQAVENLGKAIKHKNSSFQQAEAWKQTKPPEPEYAEAYKTQALAMAQYADGAARIVLRMPRAQDIVLEVMTTMAAAKAQEAAQRKAEEARAAATRPAATQPAKRPQPTTQPATPRKAAPAGKPATPKTPGKT